MMSELRSRNAYAPCSVPLAVPPNTKAHLTPPASAQRTAKPSVAPITLKSFGKRLLANSEPTYTVATPFAAADGFSTGTNAPVISPTHFWISWAANVSAASASSGTTICAAALPPFTSCTGTAEQASAEPIMPSATIAVYFILLSFMCVFI